MRLVVRSGEVTDAARASRSSSQKLQAEQHGENPHAKDARAWMRVHSPGLQYCMCLHACMDPWTRLSIQPQSVDMLRRMAARAGNMGMLQGGQVRMEMCCTLGIMGPLQHA